MKKLYLAMITLAIIIGPVAAFVLYANDDPNRITPGEELDRYWGFQATIEEQSVRCLAGAINDLINKGFRITTVYHDNTGNKTVISVNKTKKFIKSPVGYEKLKVAEKSENIKEFEPYYVDF